MMKKHIYLVGLSYKTAPVEIRERFALTDPAITSRSIIQRPDLVQEYLVLSTCNRVEILAVANDDSAAEALLQSWANACGQDIATLKQHTYTHKDSAAINHLFTVAASLDSMVLGEPQILGQLKDAYRDALKKQTAKVILNRLLHKAFSVAKRIRTETAIASSAVSISYAAVELAKRIFEDMASIRAMLIGAGEMAELAATHLLHAGIKSIHVANRTYERAIQLADHYKGTAVPFDRLFDQLSEIDIIISSTGAHEPIINAADIKHVLKKRKNKPMFFIDIAVPRDIASDVNKLDNIYLYDIDDLKEVVEENLAQRRDEAEKAITIVNEETDVFINWLKSLSLQPTIVDLIQKNERIAQEELERTLKRIGPVNAETEEALVAMLGAIIKKINHEPINYLKRRFQENPENTQSIHLIRRIFNLDEDKVPERPHYGRHCIQCKLECTIECIYHPLKNTIGSNEKVRH